MTAPAHVVDLSGMFYFNGKFRVKKNKNKNSDYVLHSITKR
jgi:hypothetical protein